MIIKIQICTNLQVYKYYMCTYVHLHMCTLSIYIKKMFNSLLFYHVRKSLSTTLTRVLFRLKRGISLKTIDVGLYPPYLFMGYVCGLCSFMASSGMLFHGLSVKKYIYREIHASYPNIWSITNGEPSSIYSFIEC